MSRIIEARVEVNQERAVPCIKALREAGGLGLREAEELYDLIRAKGALRLRFTVEQFGSMQVAHFIDADWLFSWHDMKVVTEAPRDYIVLGEALP